VIDVLTSRLRATFGAVITSENGATDADPLVSTNAGSGGRSLNWTGWAQQYRVHNKAIKRIATPDGQTRLLLLDPGVRNVRIEVTIETLHASGWAYLVAAAEGSTNHFRHAFASQGASQLQKVVGGGGGIILPGTSRPNGTVGAFKRIGLMIYGASIYGLVDGEIISEAVDSSNQGFRQVGLYFPSDTNIAVKDLTVRSVPRLFRKPLPDA